MLTCGVSASETASLAARGAVIGGGSIAAGVGATGVGATGVGATGVGATGVTATIGMATGVGCSDRVTADAR
jgi:hypothetical protein